MIETVSYTSGIALMFGILHALEPGHGKTALLTYLASGRRTWAEGLVISLSSAITHSLSVFFIAFASHFVFHHHSTGDKVHVIGEFLHLLSGGLIIALGSWLIWKGRNSNGQAVSTCCGGHHHDHDHQHDHTHDHHHSHSADAHHQEHRHKEHKRAQRGKFYTSGLLGVATGMIPCPSIVVAYLSGLSTGNSLLGVQNVILFALGMSVSLMAVVLLFTAGGMKLREKIKPRKSSFPWHYIQGGVFIGIGLFTALYH